MPTALPDHVFISNCSQNTPVMNVEIRDFTENDIEATAELFVTVFNRGPWNDDLTRETAQKRVTEILETPGGMGYVAARDGTLCGFLLGYQKQWCTGKEFHLEEMGVRPELQRSGVGTRLVNRLKTELRDRGIEQIHLLTAKDSPAFAFYEENGFQTHSKLRLQYLELD